ncbi:hypothetical protein [Aporhodopirellula aestuarii]|uniref:Uncharacterized protein n=1 Tax=Aporhodopirellula aestuarii TaxID=2950107 RepID=A0ABT0U9D6_9BACT|nr:hypothetical protein [Aporhodopirellula aestuarii]MCM2373594.1 hypothetical protein [Aporhodopirellula aestuarii]
MDHDFLVEDDSSKKQMKLWIVAGGLAIVLVGYHCSGGESEDVSVNNVSTSNVAYSPQPTQPAQSEDAKPVPWPEIRFEDLVENNPFHSSPRPDTIGSVGDDRKAAIEFVEQELAKSMEQRQKQREAMAAELAAASWKVRMILQREGKNYALIGEQTVTAGDELNGYRIREIRSDGIVLEPVAATQ